MTKDRLYLYDITLRDGVQLQGVDVLYERAGRITHILSRNMNSDPGRSPGEASATARRRESGAPAEPFAQSANWRERNKTVATPQGKY